jgi:KaiC/GvpD/RAD55 family RecA-like ATPase
MTPAAVPLFGIPELDRAVVPVLPAGWLALIEGGAGAGTHLLAKQAAHAASSFMPVFYYATHEGAAEVARVFDDYGWAMDGVTVADLDTELFGAQRAREIDVHRARARGLRLEEAVAALSPAVVPTPPSLAGRLLVDIAPLDRPFRLVLDSIDLLLELLPPAEVTTIARQLRHQAYAVGGGVLLVLQPDVPDARTLALLEVIADVIVRLDLAEEGSSFFTQISLRKVRNHPDRNRILRGSVTDHGFEAQF